MNDEENHNNLYVLRPEKFSIPGQSSNGVHPLPDLEFERDPSVPGLYRAKIDDPTFGAGNGNGTEVKIKQSGIQKTL